MKAKDCMCEDVCCVKPETKINEIAKLMSEHHIGCIPVCDENNCICGILTDRDIILRTVACNKDVENTKACDIMTTNVCTCSKEEDMTNVESKMSVNQIRRLPVCDEKNRVVGIITFGDLAQNEKKLGTQEVCSTINKICDCNTHKNEQ